MGAGCNIAAAWTRRGNASSLNSAPPASAMRLMLRETERGDEHCDVARHEAFDVEGEGE